MTNDLVHVLREHADTVTVGIDPADALVGGRRRLRRRALLRGATATVGVVCAAVLGLALVAVDDPKAVPPVATQSMDSGSFAMGALIRREGRDLVLGDSVTSYVRVPTGTVFVTGDGWVRLLPAQELEAVTIGRTDPDPPHLVADPAHDQVAWVTYPRGTEPAYVVYDVARRTSRPSWRYLDSTRTFAHPGARIYAVDGDTLYGRDSRGAVEVDLVTARSRILAPEADRGTIGSASGGKVAWRTDGSEGYVVGDRFGAGVAMRRSARPMLSTDGTYLSTDDGREVHVQRTSDGADVTPAVPASYTRAIAYGWSDDDHLLVAGVTSPLDGKTVIDLVFLTCSVGSGRCQETEEGHAYPATFNLPVGGSAPELADALGTR